MAAAVMRRQLPVLTPPPYPKEITMTDPIARLEDEMATEASEAAVRFRLAAAWLTEADRDLSTLERVTWGGPIVHSWHRAAEAVRDALEAVEAFEAFPPLD